MRDYFSYFKNQLKNQLRGRFFVSPDKSCHKWPNAVFSLAVTLLFCALNFLPISASSGDQYEISDFFDMPFEYGEVIYRIHGSSPKQLYIIGISHRDSQNGMNGSTTIQTQTDIFRIGEWLNRNRKMQLLLPEGYFDGKGNYPAISQSLKKVNNQSSAQLDNIFLEQKFADENRFVNAEMLLMENFNMRVCQVEDRPIYDAVRNSLHNLKKADTAGDTPLSERLAELQYLQETRTVKLLQKIPSLIDDAVCDGTVKDRSAMFTIGLNHIQDIVRYFENDAINIALPLSERFQPASYKSELNLIKNGYGVTIIIPRTLANDRKLLRMTNLDRVFLAERDQPQQARIN
jgi:hypothetical protein